VPWNEWEQALAGLEWHNIGPRPDYYPSDTHTLLFWNKPLRKWVGEHGTPIEGRLTAEQLHSLAAKIRSEDTVL
jgi:hypothetical protein